MADLRATADYTLLSGFVDRTLTASGVVLNLDHSIVIAQATDMLTIAGGSGSGTVRVTYFMEGTRTDLGLVPRASLEVNGGLIFDEGLLQVDIPFTFGQPFALSPILRVWVASDGFPIAGGTHQGISNYSNTAALLPFEVFDANLLPVPGATVTSDTFTYDVASPVPEPDPRLLLSAGALVGLVLVRFRNRRRV